MKHPIRVFARGVYRLHRRALWRASFIAAGPLCLVNTLAAFLTGSGLCPSLAAALLSTDAAVLFYPLTLGFVRTAVRTLKEEDPAVQDPFYACRAGCFPPALLLGLFLQLPPQILSLAVGVLDGGMSAMDPGPAGLLSLLMLAAAGGCLWFLLTFFLCPYLAAVGVSAWPSLPGESHRRMKGNRLALAGFALPLYLPYLIPFVLFVFPSGLIAAGFQAPWGAVAQTAASLLTGLFHITVSPYITLALACYAEPLYLAGKGRRPS